MQAPIRLIMFLCLPISFIVSISDKRSANSFSVASAVNYNIQRQKYYYRFSFGSNKKLEVVAKLSVPLTRRACSYVLILSA